MQKALEISSKTENMAFKTTFFDLLPNLPLHSHSYTYIDRGRDIPKKLESIIKSLELDSKEERIEEMKILLRCIHED